MLLLNNISTCSRRHLGRIGFLVESSVRTFASYTDVKLDIDDDLYFLFERQKQQFENRKDSKRAKRKQFPRIEIPLSAKMYLQSDVLNSSEMTDTVFTSRNSEKIDETITALHPGIIEDVRSQILQELKEGKSTDAKIHKSILQKLKDEEKANDINFGTPDPDIPISNVPCPGCGAKLQCQDSGIPGYMPSEKFNQYKHSSEMLKKYECHRCYVWSKYEMALDVSVTPEEYNKVVSEVRNKFALVIVVVDLTDITNSIYKGLLRLVGHKHPLYIVGNKVDLIPKDSQGYLRRVQASMRQAVSMMGLDRGKNIKHTCLVSAKTGYGIEELVTKLMKEWDRKGDVCVVGCTNAGKSTLFNALLQSDYCKSTVRDLIHTATTSIWPGTTLSLLKFPIVTAKPYRMYLRQKRLLKDRQDWAEERRLQKSIGNADVTKRKTLMGDVGITFVDELRDKFDGVNLPTFSFDNSSESLEEVELDHDHLVQSEGTMTDDMFSGSKWLYDTPGVVNPEQVINLLTQEELVAVIPREIIQPRTFVVQPGQVVLVGGIGRLDYIQGNKLIYCTVFTTPSLPVSVLNGDIADDFYRRYFYSGKLVVPCGDQERLDRFPALVGKEFILAGDTRKESIADVLLSSAGWVSVMARHDKIVKLRAYTPGGHGCCIRKPSMLPNAVNVKGKRQVRTSAFETKFRDL